MLKVAIGAVLTVTVAGQAQAQNVNTAPPGAGYDVILDLAGSVHATPTATTGVAAGDYSQYTTTFTASRNQSTISFAFRNDAGYFALDNVSAVDTTTSSGNLLFNGGFETPGFVSAYTSPIPGWNFRQDPSVSSPTPQNANSGIYGRILGYAARNGDGSADVTLLPQTGNQFFVSGAYFAYETLAQSFTTTIGDVYSISFWLADSLIAPYDTVDSSGYTLPTSTADGTGQNVVLYGPDPILEPATVALLGLGLAGLGFIRRRRA